MTDFYPGSNRKVKQYNSAVYQPVVEEEPLDLGKPQIFLSGGQPIELFGVGALAKALNRQSVTIRKWETENVIPISPFVSKSKDPRGQRRLYTKAQIEGLRDAAREEGLLEPNAKGKWRAIENTDFRKKAIRVFNTPNV